MRLVTSLSVHSPMSPAYALNCKILIILKLKCFIVVIYTWILALSEGKLTTRGLGLSLRNAVFLKQRLERRELSWGTGKDL